MFYSGHPLSLKTSELKMVKYYRINEIVKLTAVSVRTLHYYDEIKLLTPSHRTASGQRLYSQHDLFKLQQIVTFKYMGFSLVKIQKLLQEPSFNMSESLNEQANILADQVLQIEKASKLTRYLSDRISRQQSIDWEVMIKIIETLQSNEANKQKWYEKFLIKEELGELQEIFEHYTDDFWQDYHHRWRQLFDEVKQHLQTDPESDVGIYLAQKWLNLVDEIYAGKPKLKEKLWEGYKAGIIPQDQLSYDGEIVAYITQAINKLKLSSAS